MCGVAAYRQATIDDWCFGASCCTNAPDPAGNITGSSSVCEGQSGVSFSVPTINNASTYVWSYSGTGATINGSGNNVTIDFGVGATSGNLTVLGRNGCGDGVISASFPVSVNPGTVASVSITAVPAGSVCAGTNVVFTATPVNGGTPTYQWRKNGSDIANETNATYSSSTLVNGDIITCLMTSNATPCLIGSPALSNQIIMNMSSSPSTPVITAVGNTLYSNFVSGNQWYLNNSIIPGANSQAYTPLQNGSYFVIITINGCSSDTSNIINVVNVGISELTAEEGLNIYPNPAKNKITVEATIPAGDCKISIFDIQGQMLMQQAIHNEITEIDISGLAQGVYILKLKSNESNAVGRIVKE